MTTAQLAPTPIFRSFDNNGNPLAGGLLYSYAAGTTTPQATYPSQSEATPNTNPIVLNFRGEASVWLDPGLSYKLLLTDSLGNTIPGYPVDNIQGLNLSLSSAITQTTVGAALYPQSAAEALASITPTNYYYPPGNLLRYGSNALPGVTDMSVAFNSALAVAQDVYIPAGSYLFAQAAAFALQSNQTIYGDGAISVCTFSSNNTSNLSGTAVTDCVVKNLSLVVTGTGTQNSFYVGVVAFSGVSTNCVVEGCDISGYSMIGVLLQDCVSCTVRRNYFHGATLNAAAGDGAAVYLRGTAAGGCLYNVITENQVFSNSYEGIAILTGGGVPGSQGLNLKNLISNNRIGIQQGYGILLSYSGNGSYDLFNSAIGNYIENIQGASTVAGGSSGAGIYAVAAGGLTIANNTIVNCCVQTANESLAPGGIGLSAVAVNATPCVISGNTISGMTKYHGIDITSCTGAVNVIGNTILHPLANTTGNPIKNNQSSQNAITRNSITNLSTQISIYVHLVASVVTQVNVTDNTITCTGPGIVFDVTSGSLTQCNVCDNNIYSSGAYVGLALAGIIQGIIKSNNILIGATTGLTVSACTQMQICSNSVVCSSVSNALTTTGTCTGSYIDEANYLSATGGSNLGQNAIDNAATGCFVRQLGTGAPGRASHAVGDSVKNTAPTSTGTLEWVCTTVGSPGTWTAVTIP